MRSLLYPWDSSLFLLLFVFTICSNTNRICSHRIELYPFRHLAGRKSQNIVGTPVPWETISANDPPSKTRKDTSSNEVIMSTEDHKVRKQKHGFYKECVPLDVCQYCTGDVTTTKSTQDESTVVPMECMETGRRQRLECILEDNETATSSSSSSDSSSTTNTSGKTEVIYQSCRSTPEEDYFAVVRMQLLCLVLGLFSLREVNKQKRLSASMFDQRRYSNSGSSGSASSSVAGNAPPVNTKVIRKTSDAGRNYIPVPTKDDITEDATPGSNSKVKPSSTSHKNTSSTTKLNFAESPV